MGRERPGLSGRTRDQASAAVAADARGQVGCRMPSGAVVRANLVTERRSDYALSTGRASNGAVSNGEKESGGGGPPEVFSFHMDRERPGSNGGTRDQASAVAGSAAGRAGSR